VQTINNKTFGDLNQYRDVINKNKIGKKVSIKYKRNGKDKSKLVKIEKNSKIKITPYTKPSEKAIVKRSKWLRGE